ncbi:MAG TPA: hypothetical protein PKU80_02505 [Candidatus Limiplasma sp.]|nr:hypothetical protein [Candidatus Limiplasma sp.]HRX09661.1 hypothetical protein [Candidatus Limiplasma sp.]
MNTIGYDFKDSWLSLHGLSFALRLATMENVYAPDSALLSVSQEADRVSYAASGLQWAGGQKRAEGDMTLTVAYDGRGTFSVTGSAAHQTQRGKSLVLLVRGLGLQTLIGDSENMPASEVSEFRHSHAFSWPGRTATMPLIFMNCGDAPEAFALSRDTKVRQKVFAAHYDHILKEPVLVLSHGEDARVHAKRLELPLWEVGSGVPRHTVVARRFSDLETHFGMKPFEKHPERQWVSDLKAVVNLHGVHWTGHVYMTYAQQAEALQKVCEIIPGKHVLAFLPAWEGPYYRQAPEMSASEELGGDEGLKALVKTAHDLGAHIIPMLDGPNLVDDAFLRKNDMLDARMKTADGDPKIQNWIDWNSDLFYEKIGWIANFGHPGFNRKMVEISSQLIDTYGFDGVFLDGAIRWENTPDYSPYEGMKAWARALHEKHPNALLMGEDGYDLLWNEFGLFATFMQPLGLQNAMLRYTRQSWYLAYPAPGGSGGIHEQAWYSPTADGKMKEYIIPTVSFVGDTLDKHWDEAKEQLLEASRWQLKTP